MISSTVGPSLQRSALVVLFLSCAIPLFASPVEQSQDAQQLNRWFHEASEEFDVPVEVLQAVGFVESRWRHLVPENEPVETEEAAVENRPDGRRVMHGANSHPPAAYGVMGLRDDAHFGRSLMIAAGLIGRTTEELRKDPHLNIRGAAALLSAYSNGRTREHPIEEWEEAVARYSGIPERKIAQIHTYDVFNAIKLGRESERYKIDQRNISLEKIYGPEQLRILASPRLMISEPAGSPGLTIAPHSGDYGPAIWDPAASCNYTNGRSTSITHVAEHIGQGSYAGIISWFKNCDANVSAHYVVRSSDGQVTQMVAESNTAWHVAYHNSYSIGVEHEGWASDCAWYSTAMYNGSSALTRDIADSHGIPRDGTYDASLGWDTELDRYSKWKIKGHTNFPTTKSCPGACWDWPRFRNLVIGCTVQGAILDKYNSLGGVNSFLGYCTTNELTCPDGVGKFNHFQGGSIYWTPSTGAWSVQGAIKSKWANLGWETGFLRYPVTDETSTPDGTGRFNHFQGGSIYWTSSTGAWSVQGAIKAKWANLGWETGFLRYPTTDETGTPDGRGRFNHFQGGSIYWTSATGAWSVQGAIKAKWASMGWETSCLGYPVSDEFSWNGGRRSNFERGYIFWTSSAGATAYCQ